MGLLEPGVLLDEYKILRLANVGGMCLLYEAQPVAEPQSVAIKALYDLWANDAEIRNRFLNEAHVLKMLEHPHIVSAYGAGALPSGEPYIALEWLPYSLQGVLDARKSGIDIPLVVRLSRQLVEALVFLHEQNIVHRDIKASNVLLDTDDLTRARARLADLGLAKVAPERRSASGMQVSTNGQARFGTWDYMAPEQWIRSKEVDTKTDVYSLGVLMFQMISGGLPFVANDAKNLMRMHLFVEAPMELLRGKCPRLLSTLVERMLRKKAKERPNMKEVLEKLGMISGKSGMKEQVNGCE